MFNLVKTRSLGRCSCHHEKHSSLIPQFGFRYHQNYVYRQRKPRDDNSAATQLAPMADQLHTSPRTELAVSSLLSHDKEGSHQHGSSHTSTRREEHPGTTHYGNSEQTSANTASAELYVNRVLWSSCKREVRRTTSSPLAASTWRWRFCLVPSQPDRTWASHMQGSRR